MISIVCNILCINAIIPPKFQAVVEIKFSYLYVDDFTSVAMMKYKQSNRNFIKQIAIHF